MSDYDDETCGKTDECKVTGFVGHLPAVDVNRWDVLAFGLSWAMGATQTVSSLFDGLSDLAGGKARHVRERDITQIQMKRELDRILAGES